MVRAFFIQIIMVDYIIVGGGLAGISFAEQVRNAGKSFIVFNDLSQNSSLIAGGLYNPVILKRFSGLANAQEQLDEMKKFYANLPDTLPSKYDFPLPVLRKFFSIEEQNNWFAASDKPSMSPFLSTTIISKEYDGINSPLGYGEVMQTGFVDTKKLVCDYHHYLAENDLIRNESFDYSLLEIKNDSVGYKDVESSSIVFAEGFGINKNPYFNYLPLDGTKGELFIIRAENLNLDVIVNTSVFILPLGDNFYKVGATYNWEDKSDLPTQSGKEELMARIDEILDCDYEVVSHMAGVRPTVKDRKPLLGQHDDYKNLFVLNGLGTRGVMQGPALAKELFQFIENGTPIRHDYDIKRIKKKV